MPGYQCSKMLPFILSNELCIWKFPFILGKKVKKKKLHICFDFQFSIDPSCFFFTFSPNKYLEIIPEFPSAFISFMFVSSIHSALSIFPFLDTYSASERRECMSWGVIIWTERTHPQHLDDNVPLCLPLDGADFWCCDVLISCLITVPEAGLIM